jgi:hypothetical protein
MHENVRRKEAKNHAQQYGKWSHCHLNDGNHPKPAPNWKSSSICKRGSPITSQGICAIIKEITNNVLYASKSCKSGYKKTTGYLQESQTNSQTPPFFLPCFETSVFHQWLNLRFLMQRELNICCMLNNIYVVLFIKSRILFSF